MTLNPVTIQLCADIFRPPPRLKISDWAEQFAFIPSEGNEEPGKFRLSRMPHQSAMLDDPMDPRVQETFWMLASQFAGKTCCLNIQTEYAVKVLKRSVIMLRATGDTAKEWMREKFMPMVEETPAMAGLFRNPRQRDSGSTSLNRRFPGGSLKALGAKSAPRLRGGSASIVFQDEVDSYEGIKEGDPCALADRAAKTFSRSWKIKSSTPTLKGFSRIDAGYETGDKQKYFIPCPCCGHMQDLKWANVKFSFTGEEHARFSPGCDVSEFTWELGEFPVRDTRNAIYICEQCHHGWSDTMRISAYLSGHKDNPPVVVNGKELRSEWRATAPFKGIRSRHLNGLYGTIGLKDSYASYLHWFAEDFLAAKRGGRETLMVWTNLFLAEAFEESSEKTDWKVLRDRAEDYCAWIDDPVRGLPAQVVWWNWGMDVHPDRVEILSYGWGIKRECWALEKHVMYGDFDLQSFQDAVWEYLDGKTFSHVILGPLKWSIGLIDAGYQTKVQAVYQFCGKRVWRNVWACKGFDSTKAETVSVRKERKYGGKIVNLDTFYFKDTIFQRLRNVEPGQSYIHFPKADVVVTQPDGMRMTIRTGFTDRFYQMLCSERKMQVKQRLGGYKTMWVKPTSSTRNENLDCTVYAFAGLEASGAERGGDLIRKWKAVEKKWLALRPVASEAEKPAVIEPPTEVKKPEMQAIVKRSRVRRMFASPFARRF